LIPLTRSGLEAFSKPYVIENVPQAPIRADIVLEGGLVGLPLIKRRRHFETNWTFSLRQDAFYQGPVITVTGHGTTSGNRATWGRNIRVSEMREAMGIDWMNRAELSLAIPPAYCEFIGKQLMRVLEGSRDPSAPPRW
jgi:DNA (cytosine-5)-methyltransferase 1